MLANKALNVDAKCKMAVCYSGRRYLVEMIARRTVGTLQLSMLMMVCVFRDPDGSKAAPPTAGKSRFICETLHKMRLSCSVKHAKNRFSGREIFPRLSFLFSLSFFSPSCLGRRCRCLRHRLPLAVSHCMLSRIMTNLNMAHAASPRGNTPSPPVAPKRDHVCFFCEPPSKERCATLVHSDKRNGENDVR